VNVFDFGGYFPYFIENKYVSGINDDYVSPGTVPGLFLCIFRKKVFVEF